MKRIIITIILILTIALTASLVFARLIHWYSNQNNTYGWQIMTPEEQKEHYAKMRRFLKYSACKEYIDEHDRLMKERSKEKGIDLPLIQQSPCDTMKNRHMLR